MRALLLAFMLLLLGAATTATLREAAPLAKAVAARRAERLASAREELKSGVITVGEVRMPIWFTIRGQAPAGGRSLWISLHGGGSAPPEVNDQQWRNQQRLYAPEEGVYVAPRGPTDTWDLWHQAHMDPLVDRLIEDMVLVHGVNPDRVYLMGYSAGGDGVYQLGTRMADRFAAASMMAGHPNETKADNLRNLPFAIFMGGQDSAFRRNEIAAEWKTELDALAAKDPGGYPHQVTIYPQHGHWMKRDDAVAVPWLAQFTRVTRPQRIVWLQDDVTKPRFYWLENPSPKAGQRVVARRDGQVITIEEAVGVEELRVLLDDSMLDLGKPVKVVFDGRTVFEGSVSRNDAVMVRTLHDRGDSRMVFSALVSVKLREQSETIVVETRRSSPQEKAAP